MHTQRSKYWPAYTWKIQTSYSNEIKGKLTSELKISSDEFEELYFSIFDKVNSSFYHLQRLGENEDIAVEIGNAMAKIKIPGTENMLGIAGVPYEPIGYEYEAFLIKIKSSLDLIAILIAKCLKRKEDNIISLQNNIKSQNLNDKLLESKTYSIFINKKHTELLGAFKNPGIGKKSKRNYATHRGSLPIGTINVPINNPTASIMLSKALDPNDKKPHFPSKNSQDLVEFCEKLFYQTCDFLIDTLSILTNKKFTPGPKTSIYEKKQII